MRIFTSLTVLLSAFIFIALPVFAQEDLEVSVSTSHVNANPGDEITYVIRYSNAGLTPASDVIITDYFSSSGLYTYVSSIPSGTVTGNAITWDKTQIQELALLSNGEFQISVTVKAGVPGNGNSQAPNGYYISTPTGILDNYATIKSSQTTIPIQCIPVSTTLEQYCGVHINNASGVIKSATNTMVYYLIQVTNNGNVYDRYDLSSFNYDCDGPGELGFDKIPATFADQNGNPITQTEWVAPEQTYYFLLKLTTGRGTNPGNWSCHNVIATSLVGGITGAGNIQTKIEGSPRDPLVSLSKIDTKDPVEAGDIFTYTIYAFNSNDASAANNFVVKESYPSNISFISSTPAPDAGFNNQWTIGNLGYGLASAKTINIKVKVNSLNNCNGNITNTVTATYDNYDPSNAPKATVITTIKSYPDLFITKSAEVVSSPARKGDSITYTITYKNIGTCDAPNTQIKDLFDELHTNITSAGGGTQSGTQISWNLGLLVPGQAGSITYKIVIDPESTFHSGTTSILGKATISTSETESNYNNNTATTTIPVSVLPDMKVEILPVDPAIEAGTPYTYSLKISNEGDIAATDVEIKNLLPAGLTIETISNAGVALNGTITWPVIPTFEAGEDVEYQIKVTPSCSFIPSFSSVASVTSSIIDIDDTNNSITADFVVQELMRPVLANVPPDITIGCQAIPIVGSPTATDNCDNAPVVNYLGESTTRGTNPLLPDYYNYQLTRTWEAIDASGNHSLTGTQIITVEDATAPETPVLADVIVGECGGTPIAPTTTDDCKGQITGTTSTIFPITTQGATIVTWTFDDGNGNETTANQNVIVKDVTAPVPDLASLPVITAACEATAIAPTATDNCKGKITASTIDPLTFSAQGTYTIHWIYDDGNNNKFSQEQTVILKDNSAPVPDVVDLPAITGQYSITVTPPTATDNCKGKITGMTSDPLTYTVAGSYIIHWSYDDENGNIFTQTQSVVVDDTTPPETPVLADVTVGECSGTPIAPTTTDSNSGVIIGSTSTIFPITTQGTTIVTWTFDDGNGNETTANQNVIVKDVTAPIPDLVSLPVITAACEATVTAPTGTDNCKGKITASTIDPLTYSAQGTYTIHWIYDDGNNNKFSQEQTVIVKDISAPVPDIVDLPAITGQYSITVTPPTATDNCKGKITGMTSDPLTYTVAGSYLIHWSYDDENGNIFTQTQSVVLDDTTPPETPVLADVTVGECSGTPIAPTTTDSNSGVIIGSTSTIFPITTQGTTIVTWTFDDGHGNETTANQNVIVKDVTAPVPDLVSLPVITAACEATVTAPTGTDNCKGKITASTIDPLTYSAQGTYTIHWIYDDGNNNKFSQEQTVIVKDVTAPVPDLASLPVITAACEATVTVPTGTDNCKGKITASTIDPLTYSAQGTYTIHWIYDDGNNNKFSQEQTVIIKDISAPVPDVADLPAITGQYSITVTPPTATDNCKGKITGMTSDPLTYTVAGSYLIHWSYDDENGNIFTQTQSVLLDDTTPPETPVLADVTVGECSGTPIAPTTTDSNSGVITGTTSTIFPITTQGTTIVTWTFDDGNGNETTANQNVIVKDVTAPVPDVASLPVITAACEATVSAPTGTDNCKGKITASTIDPLTYSAQGTYTIHWIYDDGNNNKFSQEQTVIIKDISAPVPDIVDLPAITGQYSITVTPPTATDNCKGKITGMTSDPLTYTVAGSYLIHWSYDDENGNIFTQTQSVVVDDTTPPETPVLADVTVGECSGTPIAPTTTDGNSELIIGTTSTVFPITTQGTTIVTWTFDDGNGNVITANQNVIVKDVTAPVPDVASLPVITAACEATVTAPTGTDNCKGKITATTADPLTYSDQGSYIIHWSYDDGNGNVSTQTQSVVVDDTTPPEAPVLADVFLGECSGTPPTPTAMDNCSGIVKGTTSILFPKIKQGKNTILWTFDDGHGNVTTAYQNLILDDITAPVPDVASLPVITAECSVTVTVPTATDNCKGKITATTADPLTYSAQGSYIIHWSYDDGNGNISTQTQSVMVEDTTPPEAPVLADVFLGECSGTPPTPTAMDNCSGIVKGTTSILFPKTKQGKNTILWTFDDGHGNVTTAYQNLILDDITAPVPDVASLPVITAECSVTVTVPTATDNCKGKITATTADPLTYSDQGSYIIHWTYDDGNGNVSTQTQSVVVDDTTPPEAPVLADVTIGECSGTPIAPTTADDCSGVITGTTSTVFPLTTQGTTVVNWSFDDGNGNVTVARQNVTVHDVTPPVITGTIASITVEGCSSEDVTPAVNTVEALEVLGLSINDGCTSDALLTVTSRDISSEATPGTVTRTYTITDGSNNSTDYVQSIIVADTQKPTIVCPADLNLTADAGNCNIGGLDLELPLTNDNCSVSSVSNDAPSVFELGTTIVTWTVVDKSGNTATCQQKVNVDGSPKAMDDEINMDENTQYKGNVMLNDLGLCDTPVQMQIVTQPELGSLTAANDGGFEYIPRANYSGKDKFTYQICDRDGDCSTATVEITINSVKQPLQSVADNENLQVDVTLNGDVAANDIYSGDGNVWKLVNSPSNGTISFNPDGTYTYTPYTGFIGTDTFSYELCNANGDCSKAPVTIIVEDVLLPNQILTPNADERNDTFIITGIEYYPVNKVTIYNRWGNIVFKKNNYQNEWDGNSNLSKAGSKSLPVGTYYYLIDYGNNRHKTGFVYLDR